MLTVDRELLLEGAPNFRDLGGHRTADGSTVKRNRVFRSGQLADLTPADHRRLTPLQIRHLYDLRTEEEQASAPTRWHADDSPDVTSLPVGYPRDTKLRDIMRQLMSHGSQPDGVMAAVREAYATMALDGSAALGTMIGDLAAGKTPALVFCTAGKDRTGVAVAVLLTVLDVPRDTVIADYERTNIAMAQEMQRARNQEGMVARTSAIQSLPPETLKILLSADAAFLTAAFEAIHARYGSFAAYTESGLQLTAQQVDALRFQLLDPPQPLVA